MGKLAADDFGRDPEEEAAEKERARLDVLRELLQEEADLRADRIGNYYQRFHQHAFETEEEYRAWIESKLDRVDWVERDADGTEHASPEAQRAMQKENAPQIKGGGEKRGKSKDRPTFQKKTIAITDRESNNTKPFFVRGLTRGAHWYWLNNKEAARSAVQRLILEIKKNSIPRTVPVITREKKMRTFETTLWLDRDSDTESLHTRRRVVTMLLNEEAITRGGAAVARLNALDIPPQM